MAGKDYKASIDHAIKRLCDDLDAKYTNLFDEDKLQDLDYDTRLGKRVLVTGTYACGIWEPGDDIHLICISNNSAAIFWDYVRENLHVDKDANLPNKNHNATMELSAPSLSRIVDKSRCCLPLFVRLSRSNRAACKFFLHYAEAPMSFAIDRIVTETIPKPTDQRAQTPAVQNLDMVNDILSITLDSSFQKKTSFQQKPVIRLFSLLRSWAKSHGLIGPQLGFLNVNHLLWLAFSAISDRYLESRDLYTILEHSLKTALNILKNRLNPQMHPHFSFPKMQATVTALSPEAKQAISVATSRTLERSIGDVLRAKERSEPTEEFFDDFDYFFKVQCECWAAKRETRAHFQLTVVPRNMIRVVKYLRESKLSHHRGKLNLRIWPQPTSRTREDEEQLYVIGIKLQPHYDAETFNSEAEDILQEITNYAMDYNSRDGVIAFTLASKHKLKGEPTGEIVYVGSLEEFLPKLASPTTSEEEEEVEEDAVSAFDQDKKPPHSRKFRTARAAVARLLYDPDYTSFEFELGYSDRFENDLVWMSLDKWSGKETEDEDFIPLHRVRQLRSASNGVIVWDRENRIDYL